MTGTQTEVPPIDVVRPDPAATRGTHHRPQGGAIVVRPLPYLLRQHATAQYIYDNHSLAPVPLCEAVTTVCASVGEERADQVGYERRGVHRHDGLLTLAPFPAGRLVRGGSNECGVEHLVRHVVYEAVARSATWYVLKLKCCP